MFIILLYMGNANVITIVHKFLPMLFIYCMWDMISIFLWLLKLNINKILKFFVVIIVYLFEH